ncbi:hypothetical protein BJX62DRAFT_238877 [Aspergillus germanicus]
MPPEELNTGTSTLRFDSKVTTTHVWKLHVLNQPVSTLSAQGSSGTQIVRPNDLDQPDPTFSSRRSTRIHVARHNSLDQPGTKISFFESLNEIDRLLPQLRREKDDKNGDETSGETGDEEETYDAESSCGDTRGYDRPGNQEDNPISIHSDDEMQSIEGDQPCPFQENTTPTPDVPTQTPGASGPLSDGAGTAEYAHPQTPATFQDGGTSEEPGGPPINTDGLSPRLVDLFRDALGWDKHLESFRAMKASQEGDISYFPHRTRQALQTAYFRFTGRHAKTRKGNNRRKRRRSPSVELIDKTQRKKLCQAEAEDEDYEDTSTGEEETSDDDSSSESTTDHGEPEVKNGRTSRSTEAPKTGSRQGHSTRARTQPRDTKLAGVYMIQAAQGMLRAARALEKHESKFRVVQKRFRSSRRTSIKWERKSLNQSKMSRETDDSLLRQVEKRLDDNKRLYEESYKNIQDMLNGIRTRDGSQGQFESEMVRKRGESIEQMFKNVSASEMLKLIQGGRATP